MCLNQQQDWLRENPAHFLLRDCKLHCSMHTTHYKMKTAYYWLDYKKCILLARQCTLHTTHYTLHHKHNIHSTLHSNPWTANYTYSEKKPTTFQDKAVLWALYLTWICNSLSDCHFYTLIWVVLVSVECFAYRYVHFSVQKCNNPTM